MLNTSTVSKLDCEKLSTHETFNSKKHIVLRFLRMYEKPIVTTVKRGHVNTITKELVRDVITMAPWQEVVSDVARTGDDSSEINSQSHV